MVLSKTPHAVKEFWLSEDIALSSGEVYQSANAVGNAIAKTLPSRKSGARSR